MTTLRKFKRPALHFVGSFLSALQAVMGMPFLLATIRNSRFWGLFFFSKTSR